MNRTEILAACRAFDGKHTDGLERLAASQLGKDGFVSNLLTVTETQADQRVRVASTWLLLRCSRADIGVAARNADRIAALLADADHWEIRLHLLQMLDAVMAAKHAAVDGAWQLFGKKALSAMHKSLIRTVADENRLVRAWSLSVLGRLGNALPTARPDIARIIAIAEASEAASVKARIRGLRKAGALAWMEH